jgi:hypothetical protein
MLCVTYVMSHRTVAMYELFYYFKAPASYVTCHVRCGARRSVPPPLLIALMDHYTIDGL